MSTQNRNHFISEAIHSANAQGKYIDESTLKSLKSYLGKGEYLVHAATTISTHSLAILQDTMARFKLAYPDHSPHTNRQYSACIRDLEFFLRYATYAMLADDCSVLDERIIFGLTETYISLNISIDATVDAIQIMQDVIACLLGKENKNPIKEFLDYICCQLIQENKISKNRTAFHAKDSQDWQNWEPKTNEEWLNKDKLTQQIIQSGGAEPYLEDYAQGFFESLTHIPYRLRKQVWREREIMAALYERMDSWQKIPGFISIGVARREISGKKRLSGILSFVLGTPLDSTKKKYDIPSFVNVNSSIPELKDNEKEIPIILEESDVRQNFNTQGKIDVVSSLTPTTLVLQSGDKIAGRSSNGSEGNHVTLTTFVLTKDSSNIEKPYLLTVHHGLSGYRDVNTCELQLPVKLGEIVDYANDKQRDYARSLDIALVRLDIDQDHLIKPHLRWIDEYPKKPIPVLGGMPVQMFGGVSGHVLGEIDQSMMMYVGPNRSIIPDFSANISAQPGDSGALLVVGHFSKVSHSDSELEQDILEEWGNLIYATQGVLLGGSTRNTLKKGIFRPMTTILGWLNIHLYLP